MIDRLEMLKTRLQRIYDLAMATSSEKHFFLWLYDYVRTFDREEEMGGFVDLVKQDRDNDYGRIHELEPLATKEIEAIYMKVSKYIKDKKIEHPVITKELNEYEMAKRGDYSSSRGHLEDLYDKLTYSLMTMVEDGSEDDLRFAQQFGKVSDERRISEWIFSPSYTEYDMLKEGLKKIQETRLWYAWDKITLAYRTIDDYGHEVVKELLDSGRHFEAMNWSGLQSEMLGIIDEKNNPNRQPYEFISKDYRYYLGKVHLAEYEYLQYVVKKGLRLSKRKVTLTTAPLEVKWRLIRNDEYLVSMVNGKEITYSMGDDGAKLIVEIDKNAGAVFNEDVYEEISGVVPKTKTKKEVQRKAYDVARAINNRILNETLVQMFLKTGFDKIGFNPSYQRI